jgi:hypothetical protein
MIGADATTEADEEADVDAPSGAVPLAVAVSLMEPLAKSAAVAAYVAVHVAVAPGAREMEPFVTEGPLVPDTHVMDDRPELSAGAACWSVTPTPWRVTLPGLPMLKVYVTVFPSSCTTPGLALLLSEMAGDWVALTVVDDASFTVLTPTSDGAVAVTEPVSVIDPASMSACVTVKVAVQVSFPCGASDVSGHVIGERSASSEATLCESVTATFESVTLPVFVTRNE